MNTMKCGLRILIGVAVIYGALSVHDKAHEISDEAIGVLQPALPTPAPKTPVKRRPFDSDADFFGTDPRVQMKKPEAQAKLDEAIETDQLAICIALAGGALIVWGFYPVLRLVGHWLFMPDWVRRRMEAAVKATELKEVSHEKTGDPVPGGSAADSGRRIHPGCEHATDESSHQPAATGSGQ